MDEIETIKQAMAAAHQALALSQAYLHNTPSHRQLLALAAASPASADSPQGGDPGGGAETAGSAESAGSGGLA